MGVGNFQRDLRVKRWEKGNRRNVLAIHDGEVYNTLRHEVCVPLVRLHLLDRFGGVIGDDVARGDKSQQHLHKWKLHALREVLLHGHQLLQDKETQAALSCSNFHNIYRFGFVA